MTRTDHQLVSNEEWTCGKGLSQHAVVPSKIADFLTALSETLRAHMPTIDTSDEAGRAEWDAYSDLSEAFAVLAKRMGKVTDRMGGYGSLPAAPHHEQTLADPALMEVFARFVAIETELATLLGKFAGEDQQLLDSLRNTEA